MHRQVSDNTYSGWLFKHFLFFCLLSPSMLYAVGTKNEIAFVGASITAGVVKVPVFHKPSSYYFEQISYNNSFSVNNHSPVKNLLGLNGIINHPVDKLAKQIEKAVQRTPKVIIAIDALFWVVYRSPGDALERLEKALAVMTKAKQNFVISLLPLTSVTVLSVTYSSFAVTIDKVNKRLREWTLNQNEKHPDQGRILLLDLTSYFGDKPYLNCGAQLGKKRRTDVMSEDGVHPTEYGHLCLAGRLLEELSQSKLSQFNFIESHFDSTKLHDLSKELLHKHREL